MNRRLLFVALLTMCVSVSALYGLQSERSLQKVSDPALSVQVAYCNCPHCRARRARAHGFQGTGRLPRGRRTWQGQYFGNFNNRYYGPQYGYF